MGDKLEKLDEILALIPARGGSKGIPRKNIRSLGGKPLIAWTIITALQSSHFTSVIVSTDDNEIAEVSRHYGADVPFLRPVELASDTATSVSVALHALEWLSQNRGIRPALVMLLQPTSPLRAATDIKKAISLQRERKAEAVVSLSAVSHPPQWLKVLGPCGEVENWLRDSSPTRRQDAQPTYQLNGAIYLVKTSTLLAERTFCPKKAFGLVMPEERSLDIDTPWDFHVADLILRNCYGSTPG